MEKDFEKKNSFFHGPGFVTEGSAINLRDFHYARYSNKKFENSRFEAKILKICSHKIFLNQAWGITFKFTSLFYSSSGQLLSLIFFEATNIGTPL